MGLIQRFSQCTFLMAASEHVEADFVLRLFSSWSPIALLLPLAPCMRLIPIFWNFCTAGRPCHHAAQHPASSSRNRGSRVWKKWARQDSWAEHAQMSPSKCGKRPTARAEKPSTFVYAVRFRHKKPMKSLRPTKSGTETHEWIYCSFIFARCFQTR